MLIRRKQGWELPESAATPEAVFCDRRALAQGDGGRARSSLPGLAVARLAAAAAADDDPSAGLYPAKRNDALHARPAAHRREIFDDLQQFLRIRHRQGRSRATPRR